MCNEQTNQQTDFAEQWITKQAAIDWLTNEWDGMVTSVFDGIKNLPSAQPKSSESKRDLSDTISRQDAIAFVDCGYLRPPTELAWSDKDVVDMLKRLPSAQPEIDKAIRDAYKHGKSKGIKRGMAMARRKEAGGD